MKKKILLFVAITVMLVCVFAISTSAAEPDTTKETVTLSDGTVCPIWDTDGDALIWYVSTTNADDGYANYDYVKAQDTRVSYEANGSYSAYGSNYNQIRYIKIDETDGVSNIVVLNINDDDVVVTGDKAKGGLVNGFEYTFGGSTVLEYAYLHTSTIAFQKEAFKNCTKLVYVNFDELINLKQIESNAFWCCYNLFANEVLDLSKTALRKIGTGGLASNSTDTSKMMLYTKVILPSSLTDFGGYPFQYCLNLKTVEGLENLNVTSLPEAMFYHCPSLENVTLPSTLTSVNNKMFGFKNKVNDLTTDFKITIPANVTTMGNYVFQNNTALVEINFTGTSLTRIGTASFENAARITEIAFPEGLTYLGNCICKGASSLTTVTLPSTLVEMNDNGHFQNTAVTEVIGLENTKLTFIPASAFRGLKNWKPDVIKLPNTVTKIGQYAFADVGMKSVILSANLTEFNGSEAFVNCPNLATVYVPGTITNFNSNTFNNSLRGDILFYVTSTDSTYLANVKDKFAGADIITLDTYLADTTTYAKGRHIVSGYNVCEAFYNGVHTLDPEKSNDCAGVCANCQEQQLASNPVHDYVTTLVYTNYLSSGVKTQTCQNDGCTHKTTPVVTSVNPIISDFKGFAVSCDGDGITFGYVLDAAAIKEFEEVNKTTLTFGFVAGVKALLGDKMPLDTGATNVVSAKVDSTYTAADFVLRGDWDRNVDLDGDKTAETDIKNVEFYMAGYMIVNGTAVYLNYGSSSSSADVITFATCDVPETVE